MNPKSSKKQKKDKKKKKEKHELGIDKKKKKKHEKKKRKRADDFEKETEDGGSTSSNAMSNDSNGVNTVQVSLDKHIATSSVSNPTSGTSNTFSWGSAFAAAASLPQEELDEDFLRRTISTQEDEGLAKIASLAKEQHQKQSSPIISPSSSNTDRNPIPEDDVVENVSDRKSKKKSKKKKKRKLDESSTQSVDVDTSPSSSLSPPTNNAPLEGRMVKDPRHPGGDEQLMVLVDSRNGKVYSALDRNSNGDMIEIGKLVNEQVIIHNNIDTLLPKDDEHDDTEKKSSTLETNNGYGDAQQVDFPYPTDPDDHCESPIEAYKDIAMLLDKLCGPNQKEDLSIYDPYYCNGAVIRNLQEIGYTNVHNKKEDCYEVWSSSSKEYPEFDVFLTNPPYSDEHIPKLMGHLTSRNSRFGGTSNRPWFLLMPNWVHRKDYYRNALEQSGIRPFYLVPKKRYVYLPPKNFRDKKVSDVHKKSSPFVSMWYIWGGTQHKTDMLIDCYNKKLNSAACDLARSTSALRDLRRKVKKKK
mmetsp:Transcript_31169/g.47724  ORF Transcript_31169/g.47724 Transcript_31169/m.47724 type:complete len:526 (-) Transcript_31169:78-1655(-)|eukprot:CAMPEP_0195292042 /NCGR_PEP_ID=MMETSP0707-20130614/8579_1 /TAXON_ID=33640 /ORGANISM="Asterionellopsis glacialis, Strain CCMP134" /LENGTH=525 /DNA_ID=CAMNT_0040352421 /DNA_START=112 /DNA_END=1689 /DNA_ORIENTATION=+